jgi:hypothetical protein
MDYVEGMLDDLVALAFAKSREVVVAPTERTPAASGLATAYRF